MTASFDAELVLDAQADVGEGPAWDAAAGRRRQRAAEPHAGGLFRARPVITGPAAVPYAG